jgi:hypothetical protein
VKAEPASPGAEYRSAFYYQTTRVHGGAIEPPAPFTRDLLARAIAYRMQEQEQVHGGLAPAARRRLRALARVLDGSDGEAIEPAVPLRPGSRLLRDWGGKTHTVLVTDDGFEYEGERYRSLTQIARRITGAHWSGPRFFRVRQRGSRSPRGE